jgi:hypothetical protein
MSNDLDGLAVFVVVAAATGFRAAGERLGVSGAAPIGKRRFPACAVPSGVSSGRCLLDCFDGDSSR